MTTVQIGWLDHERVSIVFHGSLPPTGAEADEDWVDCEIHAEVGPFSGRVRASLLGKDVRAFLRQTRVLYQTLEGAAELVRVEVPGLYIKLVGDGRGHVEVSGELVDDSAQDRLSFRYTCDQTFLPELIRSLEAVVGDASHRRDGD